MPERKPSALMPLAKAADLDIEKAIRLSEESYCPVWAPLENNVKIVTPPRKERTG